MGEPTRDPTEPASGAAGALPPLDDDGRPPVAQLIDRRGRCRLVYEPIADLAHGTICGYEAVERFPGAVVPDAWRTEALRRGLEPDYDAFVVGSALHARESLPDGCFLSLNVSPAALLKERVRRALGRAGALDGLVIELVPRLVRRDEARLAACAAELREAGARLAVDDVGGADGVLRLGALVRPELAKLDAAFVAGLDRLPGRRMAVYEIQRFATRFGATLIAQGASRVEELDALLRLRVSLAQGPLIGVPGKTLTPIAFPLSRYVRERGAALLEPGTVAGLVERTPAVPAGDADALAAAFAADPELCWAVEVDAEGRPRGLHERAAFARGEPPRGEPLVVGAANGVVDAAQRAMLREPAARFDPLVCADGGGRCLGLVELDRLVEALARAADRDGERDLRR